MNIQTVAANLRNTIAGKEELLAKYKVMLESLSNKPRVVGMIQINSDLKIAWQVTIDFLLTNIAELKRILHDVEQCMSVEPIDPTTRVKDGQKFSPNYVAGHNAAISSWVGEVDRQGGSFTAEELDPNRGWK